MKQRIYAFTGIFMIVAGIVMLMRMDFTRAEDGAYILLDVRTAAEFAERHLTGAVLIPVDELRERAAAELPEREQRIYIYCRDGRRSAEAAAILRALGYTDVRDLGGIDGVTRWTIA